MGDIYTQYELSQNGFRYTEKLLYEHKKADTAIAELSAEIDKIQAILDTIEPNIIHVPDGMPRGTGVESTTENIVIKKMDNLQVRYLRGRIDEIERHRIAVDKALGYLSDTERELVRVKYEYEYPYKKCLELMGYEKSRWYEMRQEVVKKVASYMGIY